MDTSPPSIPVRKPLFNPIHHHTQAFPISAPASYPSARLLSSAARAAPAADLHKQDVKDVAATTEKWIKTVTGQKASSPADTAALYAKVFARVRRACYLGVLEGMFDRISR